MLVILYALGSFSGPNRLVLEHHPPYEFCSKVTMTFGRGLLCEKELASRVYVGNKNKRERAVTRIYTYMRVCARICKYMQVYASLRVHMRLYECICVYVLACACICVQKHVCALMGVRMRVYACICVYMRIFP